MAFVDRDDVDVLTVRAQFRADTYWFGLLPEVATDLENRKVVVPVIDNGPYGSSCAAWPGRSINRNRERRTHCRGTRSSGGASSPGPSGRDERCPHLSIPRSAPSSGARGRAVATRLPTARPFITPLWFVTDGGRSSSRPAPRAGRVGTSRYIRRWRSCSAAKGRGEPIGSFMCEVRRPATVVCRRSACCCPSSRSTISHLGP